MGKSTDKKLQRRILSSEVDDDIVDLLDYNKFSLVQLENPNKLTSLTGGK